MYFQPTYGKNLKQISPVFFIFFAYHTPKIYIFNPAVWLKGHTSIRYFLVKACKYDLGLFFFVVSLNIKIRPY